MNNKEKNSSFKRIVYVLLFFTLFSCSLSYFFYEVIYKDEYTVSGLSMFPTFQDKEVIEVRHYFQKINKLNNNDIVIFEIINDENEEDIYIKRIIGKEGDTVLIKDDKVFVNGVERDKNLITEGNLEIELKKDEYFVLGDNREVSNDSRNFGIIYDNQILSFKKNEINF